MTLYRQLLFSTLVLFGLLFGVVWFEKLQSTRTFLVNQLESHAQDTATSLGLSLSPAMQANDIPTAETMINAVFDRGYYRVIRLEKMDGTILVEKMLEVKSSGVPGWFVQLVPLETPVSESLVMAGWKQAGRLFVDAHPGYAYTTLWRTVVQISIYFLLTGAAVLMVGGAVLSLLLRPLKRVEQQAEAICRREYRLQEKLPKTRELRQVVESMNRMVGKVREMFREQSQLAESLRANAYIDQLTGLGNRRYITGQVDAGLDVTEGTGKGALLLLQVNDLQQINDERGYIDGDELLKRVAAVVKKEAEGVGNAALARLTGGSFVVYLPEINPDDVDDLAERLSTMMARLAVEDVGCSENIAHIGGVVYGVRTTTSKLLAEADNALRMAQQQGPNRWVVSSLFDEDTSQVKGRSWWKETLEQVLDRKGIILYSQDIVSSSDTSTLLHVEILSRIALAPGEIVSAGVFVPLAERLKMISRLDRIVLEKVFLLSGNQTEAESIAVNVSPSSLNDPGFYAWVMDNLRDLPSEGPRFIFEFAEFSAVLYMDVMRRFSADIRKHGHHIGLDHFGRSFSNFGYLKSLQPEYVKIDRAYTTELKQAHGGDSHFFIGALCGVAHSLDIRVVAEGVETEEQAEMFRELNVDALQGFLISRPHRLQ
ncbi:EAL domain-containing protein [Desulfopila sp. IMCC35008]|uniref:bifunctional diguanylate cyclase/phosphodiesterase n=1 Tax=Desulfopila sp. IMCC35008 TaxID=2653858 RepID=UPI0013D1E546|nr:EAL domain-containing protein [Desulfopila sp. IMCC35008]